MNIDSAPRRGDLEPVVISQISASNEAPSHYMIDIKKTRDCGYNYIDHNSQDILFEPKDYIKYEYLEDLSSQESAPSQSDRKPRKRKRNPMNWKQNVLKYLRNTGQAYETRNKTMRAKRLGSPCNEQCRLKCFENVTGDQRKQCFNEYWNLGDLYAQRNYIKERMEPVKPRYRYTTSQKGRKLNQSFYVHVDGKKIRVCKTFFLKTFDISSRIVRTVINKQTPTGDLQEEMRGKHSRRILADKIKSSIEKSIRHHINSVPRIKDATGKECIAETKTKADLYEDYKQSRIKKQKPYGTYKNYIGIFNSEFNLHTTEIGER